MPFFDRKNAHIYYETSGETGPFVTLVNGHTRSSRDFRLLSKTLVEAGYQCLCFDHRGCGLTTEQGDFSVDDMVDDILGLWELLKIEESYVLGISMGGMLSQIIAAKFPQKVRGLILVSTAAAENQLNNLDAGPWGTDLKKIETRLFDYVTPEFQERNKLLLQAMAKQIQNSVEKERFDERAKAQRSALKKLDNTSILGNIKTKTLILHGQDDKIIPIKSAFALSAAIKDSQLVTKQGIGHLLLAECSKDLTAHVKDFLADIAKK